MRKSLYLALAAVFLALPLFAGSVPPSSGPAGDDVRRELASYFANINEYSPTVLGDLQKSPATMKAIQDRIASMSDAEAAAFAQKIAKTPDWKLAPEAIAHAFPPEMLAQVNRIGSRYAAEVPEGRVMRDEALAILSVLERQPDEKLKDAGISREMVASLGATFREMSPLEAAMLHREASQKMAWDAVGGTAFDAMPPSVQRGAAALASHGPLSEKDRAELSAFRTEIVGLLQRIDALPESVRSTLKPEGVRTQVNRLGMVDDETLFMIRHGIDPGMLTTLASSVAFFEEVAALDPEELRDLESFREDLGSAFAPFDRGASAESGSVSEMLAGLQPAELMLLKRGLDTAGRWQVALPALYETLGSDQLVTRVQMLQGETVDPAILGELEAFRAEALAIVDDAAAAALADEERIARVRHNVETAPPDRLEVARQALGRLPATASTSDRFAVIALAYDFNCSVDLPDPLPNINLDFICNPIETALQTIADGINTAVTTLVNAAKSALQATISALETTFNQLVASLSATVNSIVSGLQSLTSEIWDFIQTIPDLAWNAMKTALNLLLDIEIGNGVTLRALLAEGAESALNAMKTLLGLSEGWWNAVASFTLPMIPCPPSGFHTPFGDVGDGAASDNYARYKLAIDGIIEMIPDTETSLWVKIPAQVLYLAFDFLGTCLEQAAAEADAALAAERHTLVLTNFTGLQGYVGQQINALTAQTASQSDALQTLINQQTAAINATLSLRSDEIRALVASKGTATRSQLTTESTEIKSLITTESDATQMDVAEFRELNLRLIIERALKSGVTHEIASLQLLEPLGYLGVVRDVVSDTIAAMQATQQGAGQAQKLFDGAVALLNAGSEKEAFREFAKAYQAATK